MPLKIHLVVEQVFYQIEKNALSIVIIFIIPRIHRANHYHCILVVYFIPCHVHHVRLVCVFCVHNHFADTALTFQVVLSRHVFIWVDWIVHQSALHRLSFACHNKPYSHLQAATAYRALTVD